MSSMVDLPNGMNRRHFISHLMGAAALAVPATAFTTTLLANASDLKKRHKSAILLWMGGGPSTIALAGEMDICNGRVVVLRMAPYM